MIRNSVKRFSEKIMLKQQEGPVPTGMRSASHPGIVDLPLVAEQVAIGVPCLGTEALGAP